MKKNQKLLRSQLNGLLHRLLELRDGSCLRCRKTPFQMSHIFPKGRYRSMEFDPDNVKALCWSCHWWWHKSPLEAHEFLSRIMSKERLDRLRLASQTARKVDLKLQKLYLESEIKKLEKRR